MGDRPLVSRNKRGGPRAFCIARLLMARSPAGPSRSETEDRVLPDHHPPRSSGFEQSFGIQLDDQRGGLDRPFLLTTTFNVDFFLSHPSFFPRYVSLRNFYEFWDLSLLSSQTASDSAFDSNIYVCVYSMRAKMAGPIHVKLAVAEQMSDYSIVCRFVCLSSPFPGPPFGSRGSTP